MAFWKIDLSRSAASTLWPRLLFLPLIELSDLLVQNSLPSLSSRPSNVAAAVPARDLFHATRRPFLVAKWRCTVFLFGICFFLDITTPLSDGPLFSTCAEATISFFGPGGTVSFNERQIVDGHFGARSRCAKCHPGDGSFVHVMVSLCVAGTLASPRRCGVRLYGWRSETLTWRF